MPMTHRQKQLVYDDMLNQIERELQGDTEPEVADMVEWSLAMIAEIRRLRDEWHQALQDALEAHLAE